MKSNLASILIAACAASTGVCAQNVYRCGTSYSNTPCAADAGLVDVQDSRTAEQRAQAVAGVQSEARLAKKLGKERLQREAQERAALRQASNKTRRIANVQPPVKVVKVTRHRHTVRTTKR